MRDHRLLISNETGRDVVLPAVGKESREENAPLLRVDPGAPPCAILLANAPEIVRSSTYISSSTEGPLALGPRQA